MDAAKNAVRDFMHKDGKHDTSVHEKVAPAVTNETVNKHRHENVTTAVDREVHQDHYHTTVQPVHDKKVLAEQHHHDIAPVEHRKFEHGNDDEVRRRLEAERAKFQDTTTKGETTHTQTAQPTVAGEHIHHHVHENIQPVVNRQTVEQHVVHTTIPIHETHHSSAKHHETSALPAMSMADFKQQGGSLAGREQRSDFFEGEPRNGMGHNPHDGKASDEFRRTGHVGQHEHGSTGSGLTGSHHTGSTGTGLTGDRHTGTDGTLGTGTGSGLTGSHHNGTTGTGSGLTGSHHNGTTGTGTGLTGSNHTGTTGTSGLTDGHHGTTGTHHDDASATGKKPSLLQRLNPMKDADGDGKKGLMD